MTLASGRLGRPVDVDRILTRADAQLRRLETAELAKLREAVNRAYLALAAEIRRRWPAALDDVKGASRTFAEARARALLEQLEVYVDALNLGAARTGVPQAMRELIAQGHAHGLATATTLLEKFGATAGLAAATAVIDWRAVEAAASNAAARLTAASEATQARIRQHVVDALVRGEGNAKVARRIRETLRGDGRTPDGGLWSRSVTIARTELATAKTTAAEQRYREAGVELVTWFATQDERTCEYCGARHGNAYRLGEVTVPAHPNCVIGTTVVSAAGVRAYSRRWYEGPVVTVTTSNGHRLTVTPNHPVLTPGGWVPAGRLDVGDRVLSQGGSDVIGGLGEPHHEQVHGVVEELADAFFQAPQVAAAPVPVADEHFHGDGRGSEVAVVGADRHLRPDLYAALAQQAGELFLLAAVMETLGLQRLRGAFQSFPGHRAAAGGLVGGLDLALALLGRHASPLEAFGFLAGPDDHAALAEPLVHCEGCGSELVSERAGAFASLIPPAQLVPRQVRREGRVDPGFGQHGRDSGSAAAVGATDALDGLPVAVSPEDVIAVERSGFAGHVYNLETAAGMYVADGIITHNCRCYLAPFRREFVEAGLVDVEWWRESQEEIERIVPNLNRGASPFEKANGRPAPRPVWTPASGWRSAA